MTDSQREPIGGRYQILTTLGRGGMGVVYKAHDPVLERDVAIKQMATSLVDSEEHRRRFQIEARAAARLNHPNIVTIYELEEHRGDVFIIMELLEGLSLGTLLQRGVRLPLEAQLAMLAQVCDGLDFAHSRAIVHRDIKPANLVLLPSGVVKILDFGIAQLAASGLTKQGALLGTPNYMAPEQVTGEAVDSRADLFSVGAVAYELVSGVKAFSADSVPALLLKIAEATHAPLAEVAPHVPAALTAVVDRLLSKSRDDRFARGADVRAALEAIGPIDRLDLIADAVTLALSPSEGDTLVQFAMPDRSVTTPDRSITPVASRSSVSSHRAGTTPPPPATPPGAQVPPVAMPSADAAVLAATHNLGPAVPAPVMPASGAAAPPPLPPGVMPPPLPDAGAPAPQSVVDGPPGAAHSDASPHEAPANSAEVAAANAQAAPSASAAPQALAGVPAPPSAPAAGSPSPSPSAPPIGAAVPAARRAGKGTAVIVLGLAAALFGIFVGASYMWWQRLRAEIKPRVTTESTAAATTDQPSTAQNAASQGATSSVPTSSEASSSDAQTPSSETASSDAPSSVASSSEAPPSDAPSGTPSSTTTAETPSSGATPVEAPSASASPSATEPVSPGVASAANTPASSNSARAKANASQTMPAARQPTTSARNANANAPRGATAPSESRTFREPEPPVDTTQPAPPSQLDGSPTPSGAPVESARAARSGPPPRTAVDAETVSAFRRSGDASALLGGDQTMIAAATVRIKDTIERYAKALQERDADELRGLRDVVTPAEQRLIDGPGAAVRFSDIDVDVEAPTQATAHARRIVTPAGQPSVSESVTIRLIRKPAGWVITSVSR